MSSVGDELNKRFHHVYYAMYSMTKRLHTLRNELSSETHDVSSPQNEAMPTEMVSTKLQLEECKRSYDAQERVNDLLDKGLQSCHKQLDDVRGAPLEAAQTIADLKNELSLANAEIHGLQYGYNKVVEENRQHVQKVLALRQQLQEAE